MSQTATPARDHALHWAAVAHSLYLSRSINGEDMDDASWTAYRQYMDAAYQLGVTSDEIDAYILARLGKR